jgi:hypothetical protein
MISPKISYPSSATRVQTSAFIVAWILISVMAGVTASQIGLPAGIAMGFSIGWLSLPWLYRTVFLEPLSKRDAKQAIAAGKIWLAGYLGFLVLREMI